MLGPSNFLFILLIWAGLRMVQLSVYDIGEITYWTRNARGWRDGREPVQKAWQEDLAWGLRAPRAMQGWIVNKLPLKKNMSWCHPKGFVLLGDMGDM
jgi:hypothetical protein